MHDEFNRDEQKVPWKGYDLLFILAVTIILVYFLNGIFGAVLKGFNLIEGESRQVVSGLINTLIQDTLLIGLSIALLSIKYRYPIKRKFFSFKAKAEIILNGLLGGLTILFVVLVVNAIMAAILVIFFHKEPPQQEVITLLLKTKNQWLFFGYAILIVVIAPIVEEFFFRGLVYTYIKNRHGVLLALIGSGLFFGLMHLSLWAFIGTFLGGVGLAYLYEKSESLLTSIIAHMVWNGVVTLILFIYWSNF